MSDLKLTQEESGIEGIISKVARFSEDAGVDAQFRPDCVGIQFGIEGTDLDTGAVVEAWERRALFTANTEDILRTQSEDVECYPLNKCILYTKEQENTTDFPYSKTAKQIRWVKAARVGSNKLDILLPRHYFYPRHGRAKKTILDGWTTNGGAAHPIYEKAVLNGVLELIERDSIMCAWLSRSRVFTIPTKGLEIYKNFSRFFNIVQMADLKIHFYAIINEIGIVTVVAMISSKLPPFHSFGSACRMDIVSAMEHALSEAVMIRKTQKGFISSNAQMNELRGLQQHIMMPCTYGPSMVDWLLEGLKEVDVYELEKLHQITDDMMIKKITDKFDAFCNSISMHNIPGIGEINVVKCAMPQLHPLECSISLTHKNFRRVFEFCGKSEKINFENSLETHPFG